MRSTIVGIVFAGLVAFGATGSAQAEKPLTNQDVIEMVKAGLPESTILLSVKQSQVAFATGPQDLIALKKAGVPQPVMDAMLTRGSGAPASASAATPAAVPGMPPGGYPGMMGPQGVVAIDGDQRVDLTMSMTNWRTKVRPGFLALGQRHTSMAVLSGPRATIRLADRSPVFEVSIPPNIQAGQLVKIARLQINDGNRETPQLAMTFGLSKRKNELGDEVVPSTLAPAPDSPATPFGRTYRMSPTAALEPGEYAVVLNGQYWDFGID